MSFGSHIRALRKTAGLSLAALADQIAKDKSYLSLLESGKREAPSKEVVVALAAALKEDQDVLLAMAGYISPDLRERIARRPEIFRACIQQLRTDIQTTAERKVRDGKW